MKKLLLAIILATFAVSSVGCVTTDGERNPSCISVVRDFFDKAPDDATLLPALTVDIGTIFHYFDKNEEQHVLCLLVNDRDACIKPGDAKRQCRVSDKMQLFYATGVNKIPQ